MSVMVPVDAEPLVVDYLATKMPSYEVSTRLRDREGSITVEQVAGARRSLIHDHPVITVQCWHSDETTAAEMCRTAFAHLWAMHDDAGFGDRVREVSHVGGPHHFPDPTAKHERWQATVELNLRPVKLSA